jgi:TM2 domain-containing membrane protein YozV
MSDSNQPDSKATEVSNKKLAAGLLAIFFGAFGIHKFVLGYTTPGVIMVVVTLVGGMLTCGVASFVMGVIGIIEGILYLTKTPADFEATYLKAVRPWF